MDISDCITTEYVTHNAQSPLTKVHASFEKDNPKTVLITDDDEYVGVVTQKDLVQSHIKDATKARSLMHQAPRFSPTDDIRNVARRLVESDTSVAPVFEQTELTGVVTRDEILENVLDSLDVLSVGNIFTENPVTINQDESVGKAIYQLREHKISRLPVVNDDRLVGVITTFDVIGLVVRDMHKPTQGDRSGDLERILDIPVESSMTSPAFTVSPSTSLKTAVREMLDQDYGGVIVTHANTVMGVLTKTDALRALSVTEKDSLDVQITNIEHLNRTTHEEIQEKIEDVTRKYRDLDVQHAHVRLHSHKEERKGRDLIRCGVRLRTNQGQVAGTAEKYGAGLAFNTACDTLERNVIELKNKNTTR